MTVKAVRPAGAPVGMGARFEAIEAIRKALKDENRLIARGCRGDCSCVTDEPDDEDFVYKPWTIQVDFHIGGRNPQDQSDRIDYAATFRARRAEVTMDGECKILYV